MKTPISKGSAGKALATLTLGICIQSAAHALPAPQRDFDAAEVNTLSRAGVLVPNTRVTVNNDRARICVIQFSADAFITNGDAMRVGYTIDSASPTACTSLGGPTFFLGVGATTAVWTRPIPGGLHTIRACYAVVDPGLNGGQATLVSRSLTVECRTQ